MKLQTKRKNQDQPKLHITVKQRHCDLEEKACLLKRHLTEEIEKGQKMTMRTHQALPCETPVNGEEVVAAWHTA